MKSKDLKEYSQLYKDIEREARRNFLSLPSFLKTNSYKAQRAVDLLKTNEVNHDNCNN
ncbi:MAG: hypothetical protein SFU98_07360 [Leptospiraceae bacterium]|nr:hypothetical protein [Leptospiraceae bacterium]